jgi:hypothetical protein
MMVFIGYEPGSKDWRFYNLVMWRVHVSRDAVFEEDHAWKWDEEDVRMTSHLGWSTLWLVVCDRGLAMMLDPVHHWSRR